MQRKLAVLAIVVSGFLILCSLLFGLGWNHTYSKLNLSNWITSDKANGGALSSAPPSHHDDPLVVPVLKHVNDTLLELAPQYIRAIMDPEDKTFTRLACPAPTNDRYLGLQNRSTDISHNITVPPRFFFALDLHQCARLLPRLIGSILESIRFLGPENCALSIIEGRSDDGTCEILLSLREEIERLGATYYFQSSEIDPTEGDRIKALAELRNEALQPLLDYTDQSITDASTVIFINDVAICMEDILELIYQREFQSADMTCAMDWTYVGPDPTFYDVWIARGMNGDTFFDIPEDGNWNSA